MKKIILRAALVLLVLLLFLKGFLWYRESQSHDLWIHKNADVIFKINIDKISQTMIGNAILNPRYYYDFLKTSKDSPTKESPSKGFTIPANLFLYTLKNTAHSTVFTSFPIADSTQFEAFLKFHNFKDFDSLDNLRSAFRNENRIAIAFNGKRCFVAYSQTKESVEKYFQEILIDKNLLSSKNELVNRAINSDKHIAIIGEDYSLGLQFKNGQIKFSGKISHSDEIQVTAPRAISQFSLESSVQFFMNLNTKKRFENIQIDDFTIQPDSILKYYQGHLKMEVGASVPQQDTLITYEYNDDFEKVAIAKPIEKMVPEINIEIAAHSQLFYEYLEGSNLVENGVLNKDLFPLYQMAVWPKKYNLTLSTNLKSYSTQPLVERSEAFKLHIDFLKLIEQNHIQYFSQYFKNALDCNVYGFKSNDQTITIRGVLSMKNDNINAMTQFLYD